MKWNLRELFVDSKSFYDEIEHVKTLLSDIKSYENMELNSTLLCDLLNKKWKIKEITNNILIYGSLMYYKNIKSDECIELKKTAEVFNNEVNTTLFFIDRKILDLGFEKILFFIEENPELGIYKLSIHNLFRLETHIQSDKINQKIKENIDKINEQINLYNNLLRDISYGTIDIDGKKVNITSSNFTKYISSRDRETRKQTYFIVNEAFDKSKEDFANLLNTIYGYRIENSNLEEYNSVLEKTLFEENIDSEVINKLIKSINNNLYLVQQYLKIKSELLGLEEVHLYDLGVPLDNNLKAKYSLEDAKEIILNALKPLGKEYINAVKILFNDHIDAELDDNKHQSITFSWHTYSFMNFRGSSVDLKNMIHEIGHIVNYYFSKDKQPFIYEDSTIFVGETASLVNEILLNRYLYNTASSDTEKIFYLSKEIENYFATVFKQTMYTELEDELYKIRVNSNLTSDIICNKYFDLIKKYYGEVAVCDEITNVEWTRLGKLYRWSYYHYKYATGLLIASTVVDSLIDKNTLSKEDYIKFLEAGSSQYSLDLLKTLNIDLMNTDVIEFGFNVMKKDIGELQKILSLNSKN